MPIKSEHLDELLAGYEKPEDLVGENGLFKQGSSPSAYPAEPLVSFQINRQLSGWHLPPLVIRAFGVHGQHRP
jgi:hypothetical protein